MILFLPATAPANIADVFEGGMMQVKAEYAQYAIPVTQLARPSEYFTFDYSIAEREFAGLHFGKSDSDLLPQKNFAFASGAKAWQYDMTYSRTLASTKSAVNLTEPYETVEIYDAQGNIISENLSEHWLNYEQLGDVMYGQVIMVEDNLPKVETTNEDGETVMVRVEEIDGFAYTLTALSPDNGGGFTVTGGVETGVQDITVSADGCIFDLCGRKVRPERLPSGIYIKNGKKIVIK